MSARLSPLRDELIEACARVIDSGVFVMGPEAEALEGEFADFCGARHAVAVSNGTAAIQLALMAANVGPGDEVITAANTFIATVEAISAVGAIPVLVDAQPDTYLIDPQAVRAAITPRTQAIIPVHLYGLVCDMDAIMAIAREHQLTVVEDACQAHGATFRGVSAGAIGDFGCFSLYPAKNLGTIGEGGIVTSNDADADARMRILRSHGEVRRYEHVEPGWNLRLSEILAAATRIQLRHLADWNERRRNVAAWYGDALRDLPLQLPVQPNDRSHVFHLYVVQVDDRDRVRASLAEAGIGSAVHYPTPVHQQAAYNSLGVSPGALPVVDAAAPRLLSLPMYPEMTRDHVDAVASALAAALVRTPQPVG
jgi:dTDP-4-amino-4,6-dideoxygalactose transaminase